MDSIDVRGLPESMARALAETVKRLRDQLAKRTVRPSATLPEWPLGVKSSLRREEIYDHLDGRG